MPLFDFKCERCGTVKVDALVRNRDVEVLCPADVEHGAMIPLPSAPGFCVNGFSAKNGYSGGQTYEVKVPDKDMRVYVKS